MGKKLAIKGHPTRGKEVIELLEMMGGTAAEFVEGFMETHCYYISEDTAIKYISWDYISSEEIDKYEIFTREEFLEKYPYKVGDIVDITLDYVSCVIDNMRWNSEKCCVEYHLNYLNGGEYGWHVSECLIKPENEDVIFGTKTESTGFIQMGKTVSVIFNSENYEDEVELQLGDYKIEVRDGRTFVVRKKPVYPKTYGKCCSIVGGIASTRHLQYDTTPSYKFEEDLRDSLETLRKLIICRNAYWKIAEDWKPDWDNISDKHCIYVVGKEIWFEKCQTRRCTLAFPTVEMRDTFYENFKDLIEQCKELL